MLGVDQWHVASLLRLCTVSIVRFSLLVSISAYFSTLGCPHVYSGGHLEEDTAILQLRS